MRKVVVNSTPLLVLGNIGRLYLGLNATGTMGVLIKAKQKGIIAEVKPLLDEMMKNGFFVSNKVLQMVLKAAGE